MSNAGRRWRVVGVLLLAAALSACATIPPDAGRNPADPWERYNRHMSDLNDRVDRVLVKPLAQVYADYLPEPVRNCTSNVFANLYDVPNSLNNLLQGKPAQAVSDICRVAINSTVGLLGCFDVASRMGLEKHEEDFGQTLAVWGVAAGPYFVWPVLGPNTVRDSVGRVVGFYTDPLGYVYPVRVRNSLAGVRLVDLRASVLPAEVLLERAALDRYQFIRDAFLQRRRNLVYDGNPPRIKDEDEDEPPAGTDQPKPAPAR